MSNSYIRQRITVFDNIYNDVINVIRDRAGKNWDKYKKIIDCSCIDDYHILSSSIIASECEYVRNEISNDFTWKFEDNVKDDPFYNELYLMMESNETYFYDTILETLLGPIKLFNEEQEQQQRMREQNEKKQTMKISTKIPTNKNSTYNDIDDTSEHFDYE